ncbi:phage late control D family protein [Paenibacillus sp. UNC451MF]|uniref:phage late control D family protein n=1 Tax=Paenibacillus sp. UNC451MF TaxID=1449063 RepID=UPI000490D98C|nr:contractile injection system protein, VgrG/Pvc8 family [Paenibacillus sp. UNC451MF]
MIARRAEVALFYGDVDISSSISEFLLDFTFSDNGTGSVDDLQISLEDRNQLWQSDWAPFQGDTLIASIKLINWYGEGTEDTFYCGSFEIDETSCSGPPDTIQIKGVSVPVYSSARYEKKNKAWEKVKLSTIARDIARKSGLSLVFELEDDPTYDRVDQTEQSDLGFLQSVAVKEGAAMKLTDSQLVLFDERVYEQEEPVLSLVRGQSDILSYSFNFSAADAAYSACEVSYFDPKKGKISYTFKAPGAPDDGPVLRINEKVDSIQEAMNLAKKSLREKNKEGSKASFSLMGNPDLINGVTIMVSGWGKYDGKYFVTSTKHSVGSGAYSTDIEVRRVLEGY